MCTVMFLLCLETMLQCYLEVAYEVYFFHQAPEGSCASETSGVPIWDQQIDADDLPGTDSMIVLEEGPNQSSQSCGVTSLSPMYTRNPIGKKVLSLTWDHSCFSIRCLLYYVSIISCSHYSGLQAQSQLTREGVFVCKPYGLNLQWRRPLTAFYSMERLTPTYKLYSLEILAQKMR